MNTAGILYVVGIGPGGGAGLTAEARSALEQAEGFYGYAVYTDLTAPLFPGKNTVTTPMTGEADRCRMALEAARQGKTVALVCGGDPGVYGLASLVLELAPAYPGVEVRVVPGVTAALAGAARLGAPLGHDFCVVSLSDLLTPWETIERRLRWGAAGDFVLCLYNPGSRRRQDYLRRACEIVLQYRDESTVCGLARNIGREGESVRILTLSQLRDTAADMFTTVYIGSSATEVIDGRMVTPRGYAEKQAGAGKSQRASATED